MSKSGASRRLGKLRYRLPILHLLPRNKPGDWLFGALWPARLVREQLNGWRRQ